MGGTKGKGDSAEKWGGKAKENVDLKDIATHAGNTVTKLQLAIRIKDSTAKHETKDRTRKENPKAEEGRTTKPPKVVGAHMVHTRDGASGAQRKAKAKASQD